jgi:hypothetical protein
MSAPSRPGGLPPMTVNATGIEASQRVVVPAPFDVT